MGLTEKRVRDAKAGPATRIEWDDEVPGLGLRITANGVKSFVINYRIDGRERRLTLGRAADMSLAVAREEARWVRNGARKGVDPLTEREKRKSAPTMNDAFDKFVDEHIPERLKLGKMSERTAHEYRRQIGHLRGQRVGRAKFGEMRVGDVTQEDVRRAIKDLPPVMGNRVLATISTIFTRCEVWGWRPQNANPARGIDKAVEEARDRTLSADELSALGKALDEIDGNEGAILAIRLAALTGLRIGEIREMRWRDVDLQSRVLTLPRSKTGRRLHTLPTAAVALLADAKRVGECVIPGRNPDAPLDYKAVRKHFVRACAAARIEGANLHDLRRTIMTEAAAAGVSAHLLRDMMGHRTAKMADRYIRQAGAPLTELRERIGAGMAAKLSGAPGADVAALQRPVKKASPRV